MSERPPIPEELKRSVLVEAGHRCAIPTCKHTTTEIAHIIPFKECGEHKFDNLIALCPNCHNLYDRDKKIDRKSMNIYKKNLSILSSRYSQNEIRIIDIYAMNPNSSISISENDLWTIHYLLLDKIFYLIPVSGKTLFRGVSVMPRTLALTKDGSDFLSKYRSAAAI